MIDDPEGVSASVRPVLEDPGDLARMDARILAAYRREFGPGWGRWRRSFRVPLPVAALVVVGFLICAVLALRARSGGESPAVPSAHARQAVRNDAPVVTQTSLAGFEPIDEMQAVVVGGDAR